MCDRNFDCSRETADQVCHGLRLQKLQHLVRTEFEIVSGLDARHDSGEAERIHAEIDQTRGLADRFPVDVARLADGFGDQYGQLIFRARHS
jgi:hypothetical protein